MSLVLVSSCWFLFQAKAFCSGQNLRTEYRIVIGSSGNPGNLSNLSNVLPCPAFFSSCSAYFLWCSMFHVFRLPSVPTLLRPQPSQILQDGFYVKSFLSQTSKMSTFSYSVRGGNLCTRRQQRVERCGEYDSFLAPADFPTSPQTHASAGLSF